MLPFSRRSSVPVTLALAATFMGACAASGRNVVDEESDGKNDAIEAGSILAPRAEGGSRDDPRDAGKPRDGGKRDAHASESEDAARTFEPSGSPCSSSSTQDRPCGKCGVQVRACLADDGGVTKSWGEWGACLNELTGEDACDPTATVASEACGNCGTQQRVCGLDCHFVPGIACSEPTFNGESACAPGSKDFSLGASCTLQNQGRSRTCSATCQWGSPGACETFTVAPGSVLLAAGYYNVCAHASSGGLKCWGMNDDGQLGNGTNTSITGAPTAVSSVTNVVDVALGFSHACAITSGGLVSCWGTDSDGALGSSATTSLVPTVVAGLGSASQISAGASHTCALLGTGGVKCFGRNDFGQLGDGTINYSSAPVAVAGLGAATSIAAGDKHSCAVVAGVVRCWGSNQFGELGNGSTTRSHTPVAVVALSGATAVAAGAFHTCAILGGSGAVKCWGRNDYGQIGNGGVIEAHVPQSVSGLSGAVKVSAANFHSCALLTSGQVRCWGYNGDGELGDGTTQDSTTPVVVQGVGGAVDVACGSNFSCARLASGVVKCWGDNSEGALGGTTLSGSNVPVVVSGVP